eukprot:TRINITY_DN550_c0_g2_i2.p1 TRINITY_DN550_c0_g2~~TRINITY_DN550_c0_g2_i2.p1  ORF type:complete len:455 (-),score=84.77 TRINITY_DN550_c0_g2_i2:66-1430(-)
MYLVQTLLFLLFLFFAAQSAPISLNPENPHYFLYHGKPAILIGSTEHYGSLLNLDFDYKTYLSTLKKDGMIMARVWSGTYRELNLTFGIFNNTLGPAPNRYLSPWARSSQCCYKDGGNKFDLSQWDQNYFSRLKDFLGTAQQNDVVINLGLFSRFYTQQLWDLSPMNAINNINGVGVNISCDNVYSLLQKSLIPIMQSFIEKIVTEANQFDNLFFEVINEPSTATPEWTDFVIDTIVNTESKLPQKHLISQNQGVLNPKTSIYSFHDGTPKNVKDSYHLNIAISDGETGFAGPYDVAYRTQGWQWVISGGATYDNLDYSWTAARPDGTACCPVNGPSGGGPELRKQLAILLNFINRFDFVHMAPDQETVTNFNPPHAWVGVLGHKAKTQWAIYVNQTTSISLTVQVPSGYVYDAQWLNPITGNFDKRESFSGGVYVLNSPPFAADVALSIIRRG